MGRSLVRLWKGLNMQPEYVMRVQCDTNTGETGDFIASVDDRLQPLSPVFMYLNNLFDWMRENGWKLEEYRDNNCSNKFEPWRVVRRN